MGKLKGLLECQELDKRKSAIKKVKQTTSRRERMEGTARTDTVKKKKSLEKFRDFKPIL